MNFFLDENFPKTAHRILTDLGHQVFDIRGTELAGEDDPDLFELAQSHEAVMLTTDRDFYHTIPKLYPNHHGIIVIALKQPNRALITARLLWLIEQGKIDDLKNTVVLLRDQIYRFHRSAPDDNDEQV